MSLVSSFGLNWEMLLGNQCLPRVSLTVHSEAGVYQVPSRDLVGEKKKVLTGSVQSRAATPVFLVAEIETDETVTGEIETVFSFFESV